MQRNKMKEDILYPYYGAATIMDYVNDYIFDGDYILLAGRFCHPARTAPRLWLFVRGGVGGEYMHYLNQ
jgi:hypothetical protein